MPQDRVHRSRNGAWRGGGLGLFVALFVVGAVVTTAGMIAVLVITDDNMVSIVDTTPGDCFVLPIDGEEQTIELVSVIDCAEPHDAEVVATGELNPDGELEYPDDDALFAQTEAACGKPGRLADAGFGILPVSPDEATWNGHHGTYVCLALTFGGRLVTGSVLSDYTVNAPTGRGAQSSLAVISSPVPRAIGSVG